jgi:hypothetical protein
LIGGCCMFRTFGTSCPFVSLDKLQSMLDSFHFYKTIIKQYLKEIIMIAFSNLYYLNR